MEAETAIPIFPRPKLKWGFHVFLLIYSSVYVRPTSQPCLYTLSLILFPLRGTPLPKVVSAHDTTVRLFNASCCKRFTNECNTNAAG